MLRPRWQHRLRCAGGDGDAKGTREEMAGASERESDAARVVLHADRTEAEDVFFEWTTVHKDNRVRRRKMSSVAIVPNSSAHGGFIMRGNIRIAGHKGGVYRWMMRAEEGSGQTGVMRHPESEDEYIWGGQTNVVTHDYSQVMVHPQSRFACVLDLDERCFYVGTEKRDLPKPVSKSMAPQDHLERKVISDSEWTGEEMEGEGKEWWSPICGLHHGGHLAVMRPLRTLEWTPVNHALFPRSHHKTVCAILLLHGAGECVLAQLPREVLWRVVGEFAPRVYDVGAQVAEDGDEDEDEDEEDEEEEEDDCNYDYHNDDDDDDHDVDMESLMLPL
eukprot:TRINITY_DN667_c0_g2_i1.p2 TRINITY_DN667_c0_g2~~TRINITY_DN667_c0_g2_i1.p2  ORF type:complete len:332 (-),score=94.94 TRINITY_DN667_c0_g2_i1:92-1087(-)